MTRSTEALYSAVGAFVARTVRQLLQPMADRLAALEARPAPVNGKDADPAVVARMIAEAVSAIPKPVDGKSVTADDLVPIIDGAVARAVAALPRVKDGVGVAGAVIDRSGELILTLSDGSTCELGRVVGTDGKSVTVDEIRPMVQDVAAGIVSEAKSMVRNYVDSRPPAKDGKDAPPVTSEQIADAVAAHLRAHPPAAGQSIKGDPGRGIGDMLIGDGGRLVVTFTDGTTKDVGAVRGRDGADAKGKDGADGRDGFSVDELTAELEGERVLVLKYRRGTETKEFGRVTLMHEIYRGVFKHGQSYERGDSVTWDGSTWHCNEPTKDRPGDGNKAWQLAVRKGRDGKDAPLPPPPSTTPFGEK